MMLTMPREVHLEIVEFIGCVFTAYSEEYELAYKGPVFADAVLTCLEHRDSGGVLSQDEIATLYQIREWFIRFVRRTNGTL